MEFGAKESVAAFLRLPIRTCLFLSLVLASLHSANSVSSVFSRRPIVKTVAEDVSELGEGPYWDSQNRVLYYVDAPNGEFKQLNPATRSVQKIKLANDLVSMIIPYADDPNTFIVSRRNQVLRLNWLTGDSTVLATVSPELGGLERFNDAKCDPRGRLFIGTVLEKREGGIVTNGGGLFRLDGDRFVEMARGFSISNGMAWSIDANHTKLFFNDSEGRKIYSFDYDIETGTLSNQRVMIDCAQSPDFVPDEYPDGMTIDKYGFIWVSMYNGGRIVRINTDTARVVYEVRLSRAKIPTSLTPGTYQGIPGFFVTTAANGIPQDQRLDDGKILHISLFQGGKVYKFRP